MQAKYDQLGARTVDFSQPVSPERMMWQRIRRYLIDHQISIIHSHTPRTIIHASLAKALLPGTTHIATKHLLTTPQDRKWGLPIAVYDRFSLYLPDHLVAVSNHMCKQIQSTPAISQRRVTAIPNAIPVEKFFQPGLRHDCRREFGFNSDTIAVGFAGRMEKVKTVDLLLLAYQQVLEKHPHARLLLIGEGSKQFEWQSLASKLGISHSVIWAGFRADMPRILAGIDIFVQPSVNEGLSLATLEAMAAGKAIIATNVGGTSEIIKNDQTGLLINPGSSESLAVALSDYLDNPEKRYRMANNGRVLVQEKFDVNRMTHSYHCLYWKLAYGKSSPN
jgi:glycosyltransferase involved in cell wall biosynthesis